MDLNSETYINQFDILDDNNITLFYKFLINRFNISCQEDVYHKFINFQERFYIFLENLRDLDTINIVDILNYLNNKHAYLNDIIIMSWCLPSRKFLSKMIYRKQYIKLIKNYNNKLVEIVENEIITNFCCNMLTKTTYIPIHCIDILWYYMESYTLEFSFHNMESAEYIKINIIDDNSIEIGLNIQFIFQSSLGEIKYETKKICFIDILIELITNTKLINNFTNCQTRKNYINQLKHIYAHQHEYNLQLGNLPEIQDKIDL